MAEYIERDAAIKARNRSCEKNCKECDFAIDGDSWCEGEVFVVSLLRIPAADVRPVVRGRWIHTTQPMGWRDEECAECSVCGEDFVLDEWAMDDFTNLMHFCPNCGADMREES